MPLMIECNKCREVKELHKFYEHKRKKNGRASTCKACMVKAGKAYYKERKSKVKPPNPIRILYKSFTLVITTNEYDQKRSADAAMLMFIEASPKERADKMREAKSLYG